LGIVTHFTTVISGHPDMISGSLATICYLSLVQQKQSSAQDEIIAI